MQMTSAGIDLIKSREGLKLETYLCPSGIPTIGYGHTGLDVKPGMVITEPQAYALLLKDIEVRAQAVKKRLKVQLSDNQFSALVSHFYNCGYSETLFKLINAMKFAEAAEWWKKHYVTDTFGRVLPGLVSRRAEESKIFLAG